MIVMAIIVGVLTLVAPKISNPNNQMKAAVRRFTVLTKQIRATAKLQGAAYRIVFNLKEREEDEQEYWIERSNNSILLPEDRSILEQEKRGEIEDEEEKEESRVGTGGFAPDDGILEGKQKLPDGLRFKSIEITGLDRPITQGYAYIHFHPQGLVEESAIHLVYGKDFDDNQLNWTIAIHPLTGKADIITKNVDLKEITDQ